MEIKFHKISIDENELKLIANVLQDNDFNIIEEFENTLKDYFGVKHAISTNSGTAAKHLALCALNIKRGDKVICSANAYPNVAEVIRHFDAEPIFVDINEDDFNISIESLKKTIKQYKTKKLKAIFISNAAGQASDSEQIYNIANENDIKVIEDVCRGIGVTYKNKLVGSCNCDCSCFQINPQNRTSIANIGFLLTNNDKIAEKCKLYRSHAVVKDNFDKNIELDYIYDVVDIGQKYDLSGISAGFGLAQFKKTQNLIKRRKEIASIYNEELKNCPGITLPIAKRDHVYTQYIIKIEKNRDQFAKQMFQAGIKVKLHYIPLHILSYYKQKYKYKINDFPNSLKVYQQVLSLPVYSALKDDEIKYICNTIKEIAKSRV